MSGIWIHLPVTAEGGLVRELDLFPWTASQDFKVCFLHAGRRGGISICEHGCYGSGAASCSGEHAQGHELVVRRLCLEGRRGLEFGKTLSPQCHVRLRCGLVVAVLLDVHVGWRVDH